MPILACVSCSHSFQSDAPGPRCERCGGPVLLEEEPRPVTKQELEGFPPGVWRYRAFLPLASEGDVVTLGEGGTPLLHAERLGRELGLRNLLIKDESRNPTGSFMDRGSTVLVSVAKGIRVRDFTCRTTGNLGASLAAYCAKADIRAKIRVGPNTDQGKLYQMLAYGAELETAPRAGGSASHLEVTAANPYLLEGEKTTGFEIAQDLEWDTPDVIMVPVGTGGHLLMIWHAVLELRQAGLLKRGRCRLVGVQVEGGVPAEGRRDEGVPLAELEGSEPFFRPQAARAIEDSGGNTVMATPEGTIAATGTLAKTEGVFAEPSSASVIAALSSAVEEGSISRDERVVCVITGAGLKDPRALFRLASAARRIPVQDGYVPPPPRMGETKLAIIQLLQKGPGYGYDLCRLLSADRRISTASVYQHLNELEEFGIVRRKGSVVSKGRERVDYELTKRGSEYLRVATSPGLPRPPRR